MDDGFLHDQRRDPPAGYSRALRERLRQLEDAPERRGFRLHPALTGALGVAALAVAFSIPAVRVAAQNALDLFRVRKFAAVEIDQERIEQLKKLHDGDPENMLFAKPEVLVDPGPPQDYPSADLAASAAGLPGLRQARDPLPDGLRFEKAVVSRPGAARLTVRTEPLRQVVEALGIHDVQVPTEFDGQTLTVNMPSSVTQVYKNDANSIRLTVTEAMTPEVALPPGADLQRLGEVALRVIGLDANEARRVAASIDWRNTMLVPVPASAASFRQVEVNGHRGLLVRTNPGEDSNRKRQAIVMWTEGERVHAVQGNLSPEDVLVVAQSLR